MIHGEYYLHINGKLIYKPHGGVELDSTCVVRCWSAASIGKTPHSFTEWLKEAFELGAKKDRIFELANKNKLKDYVPDWAEIVGVL